MKGDILIHMIKVAEYKIRQAGRRGYAISLPRHWVEANGLRQGMPLEMYVDDDGLKVVVPSTNPEQSEKRTDGPSHGAEGNLGGVQ